MNFTVLAIQTAVSLADPLSLVGYIAAGAFIRKLWIALSVGALWAILMDVFVIAMSAGGYGGTLLGQRIIGGLIATAIVFGITHLVRRSLAA